MYVIMTHGHAAGEAVLEAVAARCRPILREADIIGRYGGEEFAVLLSQTNEQSWYWTDHNRPAQVYRIQNSEQSICQSKDPKDHA
jgi:diguanylate cyclase (GGDEF)-like protein